MYYYTNVFLHTSWKSCYNTHHPKKIHTDPLTFSKPHNISLLFTYIDWLSRCLTDKTRFVLLSYYYRTGVREWCNIIFNISGDTFSDDFWGSTVRKNNIVYILWLSNTYRYGRKLRLEVPGSTTRPFKRIFVKHYYEIFFNKTEWKRYTII